jgi:hypothetical protein
MNIIPCIHVLNFRACTQTQHTHNPVMSFPNLWVWLLLVSLLSIRFWKSKMIKNTICCYVSGNKHNILSTTFSWSSRNATMIFRLSRCIQCMTYYLVDWVSNFSIDINFHFMSKSKIWPTNSIYYPTKKFSWMTAEPSTSRTQLFRSAFHY